MKVIKKVVSFLSLVLLLGGVVLILYTYLTNHTFVNKLTSLMTNAECKKGMLFLLIGFAFLVTSFIFFSLSMRMGSSIRRKEKEQAALDRARWEQEEERNRQLQEEAAAARAEAERYRTEATAAQQLLSKDASQEIE